jgi:mono/diheme cytochrome c family protein
MYRQSPRRPLALFALVLLALGCPRSPAAPPAAPLTGLTATERQRFYHLSMGSELMPLAWLRALESAQTGKPFLVDVERFGLLPDPADPDGLPVGLSAAESRDLRFAGKVVGLSCAACHVGELVYKGKKLRLDGAPGLFDADAFTKDLVESVILTLKTPDRLLAFLKRVHSDPAHARALAAARPGARAVLGAFPTMASLRSAGEMEKSLAGRLEVLLKQEGGRAAADLGSGLLQKGAGASAELRKLIGDIRQGDLRDLLALKPGAGSPLAQLKTAAERTAALTQTLEHLAETTRLLKARLAFAQKLLAERKRGLPTTAAGPGRADDFGLARNLIFDARLAGPLTAPCSVSHLWGVGRVRWQDWDGNTTSAMGRSVATALAAGAVFDPATFASTVLPKNLAELDNLATRIPPPAWPEELFGKIDAAKARRGAALFKQHCADCHQEAERLFDPKEVGTDPTRLRNFAAKLGDQEFADALRVTVGKYAQRAYRDNGISDQEARKLEAGRPNQWRTTNKYTARSLVSVWATAPYLHNGSVPTLYDLLLPAAQRPKKFPLGQRDYDPKKLGYTTDVAKPRFIFDTSLPGNSNAGHEYGTRLSEEDRWALLEYLKSI